MPYDERVAERIRSLLQDHRHITEKKMFAGVSGCALMVRVGKDNHADSLGRMHVRPMDFTGEPMQGYVFVGSGGTKTAAQLRFWLDRCERFVATLPPKGCQMTFAYGNDGPRFNPALHPTCCSGLRLLVHLGELRVDSTNRISQTLPH